MRTRWREGVPASRERDGARTRTRRRRTGCAFGAGLGIHKSSDATPLGPCSKSNMHGLRLKMGTAVQSDSDYRPVRPMRIRDRRSRSTLRPVVTLRHRGREKRASPAELVRHWRRRPIRSSLSSDFQRSFAASVRISDIIARSRGPRFLYAPSILSHMSWALVQEPSRNFAST